VLGLYFFSYGVIVVLHARQFVSEETFELVQKTIYSPLAWLSMRSSPFENFVRWWEYLWMSL
jgi:hypothetical protein